MNVDFLVVGSGLTGATIARILQDEGRNVVVLERRHHIGGNVHDDSHPSGIRIHTYGPHYFRTGSKRIWDFVNRFGIFYPYEACLLTQIDDRYESWPALEGYIRTEIGHSWKPAFTGSPRNFEEASLSMMPKEIYERFIKGYTEKQWGVQAKDLSSELARRIEVRTDHDRRLFKNQYQGLPLDGYANLMANMLKGIPTLLSCDYLKNRREFKVNEFLIYTGGIDEFFSYRFGKLLYRGQSRESKYMKDVDWFQPSGQVNNPGIDAGSHIRTLEWKYMMPEQYRERIRGTVITMETPVWPETADGNEYPFPDRENILLFERYRRLLDGLRKVVVCGRLGEYRYYDMDQAIGRAFQIADKVLGKGKS